MENQTEEARATASKETKDVRPISFDPRVYPLDNPYVLLCYNAKWEKWSAEEVAQKFELDQIRNMKAILGIASVSDEINEDKGKKFRINLRRYASLINSPGAEGNNEEERKRIYGKVASKHYNRLDAQLISYVKDIVHGSMKWRCYEYLSRVRARVEEEIERDYKNKWMEEDKVAAKSLGEMKLTYRRYPIPFPEAAPNYREIYEMLTSEIFRKAGKTFNLFDAEGRGVEITYRLLDNAEKLKLSSPA